MGGNIAVRLRPVLVAVLALLALGLPPQVALAGHHSSGSTRASGHSHSSGGTSTPHSSAGSVHVRGYTRKDGTHVAPYTRSLPHSSAPRVPRGSAQRSKSTVPKSPPLQSKSGSSTKRSKAERDEFMREHPCPSTGKTSGACPGYVVDHVRALKHGGPDAPSNMQWQTIDAAKAKDKWE